MTTMESIRERLATCSDDSLRRRRIPYGYAHPLPWCSYCGAPYSDVNAYEIPIYSDGRLLRDVLEEIRGLLRMHHPHRRSRDHMVPRALRKGIPYNTVDCCLACNNLKASKPLLQFLLHHKLMRHG
jgi:hypothetical protein